MAKPMSLAEFRKTVKLKGQKSRLFCLKAEIFEAVEMGMSLVQIVDFLKLHGIKISKQALHRWVKSQIQKTVQKQPNTLIHVEPRVEPKEAPTLTNDDDFYNHLRKVADKRAKWLGTNPYIKQEEI